MFDVELTDEFIDRVTKNIMQSLDLGPMLQADLACPFDVARQIEQLVEVTIGRQLCLARQPVYRFLFEVRAPSRIAASRTLNDALKSGDLFEKHGITMTDPDDRRTR